MFLSSMMSSTPWSVENKMSQGAGLSKLRGAEGAHSSQTPPPTRVAYIAISDIMP